MNQLADKVDLSIKKELIRKQSVFSQLTEVENQELAELMEEQYVMKGQTIVTEGEHVDSVYLIVKGMADVRHINIKEDNTTKTTSISTLTTGDTIGLNETGFYSITGLRTATVVAISDMVLLRLSVAAFHGFSLAHTHVSDVMHKNAEAFMKMK